MTKLLRVGLLVGASALLLAACTQAPTGASTTTSQNTTAAANVGTTPSASPDVMVKNTSTTDAQLDIDQKAIDGDMGKLNSDSTSVDKAMSDTQIDVNK